MRVRCDNCGRFLDKKPSEVNSYEHHFCSRDCHYEFRSNKVEVECANCGRKFRKKKSYARKSELDFCSPECSNEYRGAYTEEEDNIIRENLHLSDEEIAKKLEDRSPYSVRVRRQKLGLMKGDRWPGGKSRVKLSRSHSGKRASLESRAKKSKNMRKLGASDLLNIVSLRESGMTFEEIRSALGLDVSLSTVERYYDFYRSGRYRVENDEIVVT